MSEAAAGVNLTARERELLSLLDGGMSLDDVVERLCVARKTVHFHLGNAYRKLGVDRLHLACVRARRLGLLDAS
jgi:DNA-binding CsgD family transcriptional regulator